jgi:methyltransferase (TIGR00027 family)
MQEGKFSRTAYGVALRRAAHQLFDNPKVLDDPFALRIIGENAADELRSKSREAGSSISRAFRAFLAARSRYAEDQIAQAVDRGTSQCVVLGAGLDTFAYRNPHLGLRVFEIDHPATQAWKRERLRIAAIPVPPSVTFVPVDFERQTFSEELGQWGFDPNSPAFFSWLGVTPYLTRDAFMATLRFIAERPAGSGVVFDFAVDRELLNLRQKLALYVLSKRVAMAGEPFQLFFDPEKLAEELRQMVFTRTEALDGAQINARYFKNRSDGLQVGGGLGQLMGAWV